MRTVLSCSRIRNNIRRSSFTSSATGREYKIKYFISCDTEGVVYALVCPCGYIRRTKRAVKKRIKEHIYNISIGYPKHHLSKHFWQHMIRTPQDSNFGEWKYAKVIGEGEIKLGNWAKESQFGFMSLKMWPHNV